MRVKNDHRSEFSKHSLFTFYNWLASLPCKDKTVHLHFSPYKAVAPASPFFSVEGNETPSKKCNILISAVTFSTNGL